MGEKEKCGRGVDKKNRTTLNRANTNHTKYRSSAGVEMSFQHKELAQGRWQQLSLLEQLANVGSEVERALNWKAKNNAEYAQKAFERALELLGLTIDAAQRKSSRKELTRVREALLDFFSGENEFQ
jgi:hypothetical protein